MSKQNKKEYTLNREKYKAIKKFDHQQLENFCCDIYKSGKVAGFKEGYQIAYSDAAKQQEASDGGSDIGLADIIKAIGEVKGIGPKKLEEIESVMKAVLFPDAVGDEVENCVR